jgi:phosphoribosylglycinamide formyltransferase-1
MGTCRIVVLISGGGTNLQALIDATASGFIPGRIVAVISNEPEAYGLERARRAGIPAEVVDHRAFPSREAFEAELLARIERHRPDVVALAGFMRVLGPRIVAVLRGRMLNIHPSLLPRHRGLHTHRRALEAGEAEHGASVHFVTEELDGGPVILQAAVPVLPGDDEGRLAARVLEKEHLIYPLAVRWLCQGRVEMTDHGVLLDGRPLQRPLRLDRLPEAEWAPLARRV